MEAPKVGAKSHDWLKWKPEWNYNDDHLSVENLKHCNMEYWTSEQCLAITSISLYKSICLPQNQLGQTETNLPACEWF